MVWFMVCQAEKFFCRKYSGDHLSIGGCDDGRGSPHPDPQPLQAGDPPVTSDLGDQGIPHLLGLGIEFQGQGAVIGLHRLAKPSQVL